MFLSRKQKQLVELVCIKSYLKSKRKTKKRIWLKTWINRRFSFGLHNRLTQELRMEDPHSFRSFLRINVEMFDHLLNLVAPFIIKKDTKMRLSIPASERLNVCLRYLATGFLFL